MHLRIVMLLVLCVAGCSAPKIEPNAPLDVKQLPAPALQAAKKRFPDVTFNAAWKTPNGDFELAGKTKSGKKHELVVTPAGEILESE